MARPSPKCLGVKDRVDRLRRRHSTRADLRSHPWHPAVLAVDRLLIRGDRRRAALVVPAVDPQSQGMNRIVALLCLAAVNVVGAEQEPRSVSRFDAPLSAEARKLSTTSGNPPASAAKCGVSFPVGFDPRKDTLILVWNSPQTASA